MIAYRTPLGVFVVYYFKIQSASPHRSSFLFVYSKRFISHIKYFTIITVFTVHRAKFTSVSRDISVRSFFGYKHTESGKLKFVEETRFPYNFVKYTEGSDRTFNLKRCNTTPSHRFIEQYHQFFSFHGSNSFKAR